MAEVRIGYGKSLDSYKTKSVENENLDIEVRLENGDVVEVNTREHGYAVRIKEYGKSRKAVIDKDFK